MEQPVLIKNPLEVEPDYLSLFERKLKVIKPLSNDDQIANAEYFSILGIKRVKICAPVIIFGDGKNIYIDDLKKFVNNGFIHLQEREEFKRNFGFEIPGPSSSGYLLQDENGINYLIFDPMETSGFLEISKQKCMDLMQRYNISKAAGRISDSPESRYDTYKDIIIYDTDIIGERREDLRLLEIARKYKMTNTQFMRFRILAKSAIDAVKEGKFKGLPNVQILRDVEEIAREVVGEIKE